MATSIASVATVQFSSATQILRTSWCPDKDLLVVFSRVSHQSKMTLYKMQGAKKWEVVIQPRQVGKAEVDIVGVAWSPDGTCNDRSIHISTSPNRQTVAQFIAVVSNPACIAVHSTQDGHVVNEIPFDNGDKIKLVDVWWFREEKQVVGNGLPDIFKRGDNIVSITVYLTWVAPQLGLCQTGSALAILKSLPLLDPIQDDTKPLKCAAPSNPRAPLLTPSQLQRPICISGHAESCSSDGQSRARKHRGMALLPARPRRGIYCVKYPHGSACISRRSGRAGRHEPKQRSRRRG